MKLLFYVQRYRVVKLYQCNLRRFSNSPCSRTNDSYHFKSSPIPLTSLTLGKALDKLAKDNGDHTVYISHQQGICKTYSELKNEAEKLASGLIACGLRRGDRIGIYSPNCYEWPLAQIAAAKAGLVAVTINFASQPIEVEQCLKKTGCKSVISFDKLKYLDYYTVFNKIIPNLESSNPMKLQVEKLPNLETLIMISEDNKRGTIRFKDVMNMGNQESDKILSEVEKLIQCDDPVMLQFTSGTTGIPKAAILTHYCMINGSRNMFHRLGFHIKPPIVCNQVPLFHVFGCILGIFIPLTIKSTTVLPSSIFDASENLKAIEKYKCTSANGTPTMFIDLVKTYKKMKSDITSLNSVIVGGSSIPEGVLRDYFYELKIPNIQRGYGLTETSACASLQGLKTDFDNVMSGFMEPLDGFELKIVDFDNQIVPKHTPGEICLKGYQMFAGYWEDKEKTAEAVDKEGWFHTGDIGEMNDKGWIKIVARLKDIIIRGGENIYASEIENFLSNHPAILEIYVCGVPDERLGEELCCWIQVKPEMTLTEEEVRKFCEGKLSYFKIPRYIMFVDGFPKSTVGKVKKFLMTKMSVEKLHL